MHVLTDRWKEREECFIITCTCIMYFMCRDLSSSETGNGEGGLDSQGGLTPHQQHQQYLGDHRPELDPFPDMDWEGKLLPGQSLY